MQDHLDDIKEIRGLMERSSRFLSLSGTSGIVIGLYVFAYATVLVGFYGIPVVGVLPDSLMLLEGQAIFIWAHALLFLSLMTSGVLTIRETKRRGEKLWTRTTQELFLSMAIPLLSGVGILSYEVWYYDISHFFSYTLVFYGLAIFAASRYSFAQLKYMGMVDVGLGVIALWKPEFALLCWVIGFGLMHMVYGWLMGKK